MFLILIAYSLTITSPGRFQIVVILVTDVHWRRTISWTGYSSRSGR